MPRSRSKRSSYTPPKPAKPKPSPKWVPYVGVGLVVLAILVLEFLLVLEVLLEEVDPQREAYGQGKRVRNDEQDGFHAPLVASPRHALQ